MLTNSKNAKKDIAAAIRVIAPCASTDVLKKQLPLTTPVSHHFILGISKYFVSEIIELFAYSLYYRTEFIRV
jgi:hypothetical protein